MSQGHRALLSQTSLELLLNGLDELTVAEQAEDFLLVTGQDKEEVKRLADDAHNQLANHTPPQQTRAFDPSLDRRNLHLQTAAVESFHAKLVASGFDHEATGVYTRPINDGFLFVLEPRIEVRLGTMAVQASPSIGVRHTWAEELMARFMPVTGPYDPPTTFAIPLHELTPQPGVQLLRVDPSDALGSKLDQLLETVSTHGLPFGRSCATTASMERALAAYKYPSFFEDRRLAILRALLQDYRGAELALNRHIRRLAYLPAPSASRYRTFIRSFLDYFCIAQLIPASESSQKKTIRQEDEAGLGYLHLEYATKQRTLIELTTSPAQEELIHTALAYLLLRDDIEFEGFVGSPKATGYGLLSTLEEAWAKDK